MTASSTDLDGQFKRSRRRQRAGRRCAKQLAAFDDLKPAPLPPPLAVTDVGPGRPADGDPREPQAEPIEPGFLTVLERRAGPDRAAAGRRPARPAGARRWRAGSTGPTTRSPRG